MSPDLNVTSLSLLFLKIFVVRRPRASPGICNGDKLSVLDDTGSNSSVVIAIVVEVVVVELSCGVGNGHLPVHGSG